MNMRVFAAMAVVAIGIGLPIFGLGIIIYLLSLVDVQAQFLGIGQD